jgi:hypothetical protein
MRAPFSHLRMELQNAIVSPFGNAMPYDSQRTSNGTQDRMVRLRQ